MWCRHWHCTYNIDQWSQHNRHWTSIVQIIYRKQLCLTRCWWWYSPCNKAYALQHQLLRPEIDKTTSRTSSCFFFSLFCLSEQFLSILFFGIVVYYTANVGPLYIVIYFYCHWRRCRRIIKKKKNDGFHKQFNSHLHIRSPLALVAWHLMRPQLSNIQKLVYLRNYITHCHCTV